MERAQPKSDGYSLTRAVVCSFAMEANAGRKKRSGFASLAVLAIGIAPLVNSLDNPRLAGLRGPDVLQLIAIGLCAGVALMFLIEFLHGRESA